MRCGRCAGERFTKAGRDRSQRPLYRCRECGRRVTARTESAFSGYRFPDEVIALAVRWYLRFRLSYAEVAEWLAERGVTVDPSTIYDWVQAFTPRFIEAARQDHSPVGALARGRNPAEDRWALAVRVPLPRRARADRRRVPERSPRCGVRSCLLRARPRFERRGADPHPK